MFIHWKLSLSWSHGVKSADEDYLLPSGRLLNSCSTMLSSAKVEMSPTSWSLMAIFLKTRLIIFPDLVFGSPGACWITSGIANGPIFSRTEMKKIYEICYIGNVISIWFSYLKGKVFLNPQVPTRSFNLLNYIFSIRF